MIARSTVRLLAAACCLGWAACAASPAQAEEATPVWDRAPTQADYDLAYPRAALVSRTSGGVSLACRIDAEGALSCSVVSEEPADAGFGDAALTLAGVMRAAPEMSDGRSSENEEVELQILFDPGPEAEAE